MHKVKKRKQNFMHKHTAKAYNKTTRSVPLLLVVLVSRDFPMIPLHSEGLGGGGLRNNPFCLGGMNIF